MKCEIPVACELGVFTAEERAEHQNRVEKVVFGKPLSVREEAQGFVLRYASGEDTLVELSRWVAKESRCCPFLRFRLDMSDPTNEIELRLMGNQEAKDFVRMAIGKINHRRLVISAERG